MSKKRNSQKSVTKRSKRKSRTSKGKLHVEYIEMPTVFEWLETEITAEFGNLRDFIEETSFMIIKEGKRVEAEMKKEEEKYKNDHESLDAIWGFYGEDLIKYGNTYVRLFFNTTFVSSVSMFEYYLKKICTLFYTQYDLTVNDINGAGNIGTSKKYLQKVVRLKIDDLEDTWKLIVKYNEIRNSIVHDDADINPQKKPNLSGIEKYQFLKNSTFVKFKGKTGQFWIVDKAFTIQFIDKAEEYLEGVLKNLHNQLKPQREKRKVVFRA